MTHPTPDPAALRARIAALTDEHAVTTLALVLQRQGHPIDPFTQDQHQAHLREALTQPDVTTAVTPIPGTSDGDLARTALTHLADTDPGSGELIERAIHIAPSTERAPP